MNQLIEVLKGEVTIVDVRSPIEFKRSHIEGSINIPIGILPIRLGELRLKGPIVVYCQTGVRSVIATDIIRKYGLTVYNGGSIKNMMDFKQLEKE